MLQMKLKMWDKIEPPTIHNLEDALRKEELNSYRWRRAVYQ